MTKRTITKIKRIINKKVKKNIKKTMKKKILHKNLLKYFQNSLDYVKKLCIFIDNLLKKPNHLIKHKMFFKYK